MKMFLVIVDTVGDPAGLHPSFTPRFPWVTSWGGVEPAAIFGTRFHPHGSMCAEKILQPLHQLPQGISEIHVRFLRIFDGNGAFQSSFASDDVFSILREYREECDFLYVNNSWGGYVGSRGANSREIAEAAKWRKLIEDTGAVVFWAAGNDGDFGVDDDNDMPQTLLVDVSHKVASHDASFTPSSFSSDSTVGPPVATLWAEDVELLNGVDGVWEKGSGTSFACPKLCGLAAALLLDYKGVLGLARDMGKRPAEYTIMDPQHRHPKWGLGSLEAWYQRKIVDSPALWEKTVAENLSATISRLEMRRAWFGYRRL